jgi:ABC-type sugar transport system permease subunit
MAHASNVWSSRMRHMGPPVLFLAPAGIILVVLMGIPMVSAILLSFQRWNGMSAAAWIGLNNYLQLFRDRLFINALWNTAYFTGATVLFKASIPLIIAALLNSGVRGSTAFRTLFFMPVIISLAISGLLWAMILEPNFGLLNEGLRAIGLDRLTRLWLADKGTVMPTIIGVSVWHDIGFYLVIYFAAIRGIPGDLYEAARIDGANIWHEFWDVTVPMLRPIIALVVVLNTVNGVKAFDQIWVMTTGGPNHASDTLGTYLYSIAFGGAGSSNPQLGYAAAIAVVILLISFTLSVLQLRLGRRDELD